MAKIIGLPKLSPTMDEGTLVSWQKKEGDSVDVDDLLAEVETDKATMEFRSFDKGVLLKILIPEGETLAPDTPVAIIGKEGEDISGLVEEAKQGGGSPSEAPKAPEEKQASEAKQGSNGQSKQETSSEASASPAASSTEAQTQQAEAPSVDEDGRVRASPLVRRLAREQGLDLRQVSGSGPKGRIIKSDIENFQKESGAPGGGVDAAKPRVEKLSQMRKTIARRLTESTQQIPHFYLTIDIDVAPLMEARKAINQELEESGEKVSLNDMVIKGVAGALRRFPQANASFQGDEIHYHNRVDISVAVAIPDGLITPVIRNADQKGIAAIAREVRELAKRAKDKKLQPEEFTNGTFSVSNLGMFGIEEFTAVINPPEAAILAVGTARDEAVVQKGQLAAGKRMRMTMSCDHRVIDGAVGAQFLAILKRMLESPATMLL